MLGIYGVRLLVKFSNSQEILSQLENRFKYKMESHLHLIDLSLIFSIIAAFALIFAMPYVIEDVKNLALLSNKTNWTISVNNFS